MYAPVVFRKELGRSIRNAQRHRAGKRPNRAQDSPHPDADLIALADRCIAANERFDVAADAYARAEFASPHDEAEEAEADRAQTAALDQTQELCLPLARMQPSTFDGLLAKAKALKFAIPKGDAMARIIEEALEEDPFVPEPMSLVLARDLIVLADQKDRERAKAGRQPKLRRSPPSLKPPSKCSALSFMAPALTRNPTPRPRASMRSRGRSSRCRRPT